MFKFYPETFVNKFFMFIFSAFTEFTRKSAEAAKEIAVAATKPNSEPAPAPAATKKEESEKQEAAAAENKAEAKEYGGNEEVENKPAPESVPDEEKKDEQV